MDEQGDIARRGSSLLIAIVVIFLALSAVAFYYGIEAYVGGRDGSVLLLIGFSGFALSAYMLLQTRRKTQRLIFRPYQIATTMLCPKCGFKNIREFERGDYIFKEDVDDCPKCKEKMMIASIYREPEEKETS
ncbi:MAG: hypothetical protein ACE5L6_00790 [Candidatus Bathyarchaeia archaeon]